MRKLQGGLEEPKPVEEFVGKVGGSGPDYLLPEDGVRQLIDFRLSFHGWMVTLGRCSAKSDPGGIGQVGQPAFDVETSGRRP